MQRNVWWLALCLGLACRANAPKEEPPAPVVAVSAPAAVSASAKPAELTCAERVAVMQKRLTAASERPGELGVDAGITVPRIDQVAGREVPPAPMIAVSAAAVTVDGQEEADIVALLERKRALWKSFNPGVTNKQWDVVFTADAKLPAKRLAEIVNAVGHAGWTPWLMVRVPDYEHVPRDPPPWVKELITALHTEDWEPADKASRLSDAIARAVGTCASVVEVFGHLGKSVDPSDKGKVLAAELPAGVAGCDCGLDVDALEALIVETLAGSDVRHRALPLPTTIADVGSVQDLAKP